MKRKTKERFARLFGRIACIFGNHTFSPVMMDFVRVDTSDNYGIYRIDCNCIWCGVHYTGLVKIAADDYEKLKEE